ncbi:MAG: hypothetical protein NC342_01560 [Pseudoflavonifractor sp.]|nr:potassium transporter [Alloprevotella sp.]MCM1116210.1 hypothetical protein [Pseudoflavonifractor sp.]
MKKETRSKWIIRRIETSLMRAGRGYRRMTHRFIKAIRRISLGLHVVSVVASVLMLASFVVLLGFDHSGHDIAILRGVIRASRIIFIVDILFGLIANPPTKGSKRGLVRMVAEAGILITLLPLLYPRPVHPWVPWLSSLLYSNHFIYPVLAAYAIVEVSEAVMHLVGRRTNPSLILSCSFLVVIFIGSVLLMLPRCTYGSLSYVDALFVSTSAVCITGLTPIDPFVTFTPLGILILSLLIQIGGLGVMTFTSFFALFFSGRQSIYSQLMLRDMIYSKSMNSLVPTLLYILGFTVTLELIGAVAIFFSINDTLGLPFWDTVKISLFHSLSAFCNAGFSIIPGGLSNPLLLFGNISIYWITSALVVLGAIGFPILVNFKDAIFIKVRGLWRMALGRKASEPRQVHIYDMNTKIVLVTFFLLLAFSTGFFMLCEWSNTLSGMDLVGRLTQSVFNAVTPRSAGFASVNPAGFLNITLVMVMFMMWVGGASQSTAGGIKVNTLAAICLNLRCIVTGRERVTAFRRTIAVWSIRRANAVVAISILSYFIFSVAILALEPTMSPRMTLFETLSALFTVGSSLGATPLLSTASKLILCAAMFLGRVGIISLMAGIAGRRHDSFAVFPTDNLIIN